MLKLDWTYPVQHFTTVESVEDGRSTARSVQRVLAEQEAYYEIAGEDRRPLLVLRECSFCNGMTIPCTAISGCFLYRSNKPRAKRWKRIMQ